MTLLGLSGRKRSGKDTVCQIITRHANAVRLAFADSLKEELAAACGVPVRLIDEQKERFRPGLQWWGTEFRRHDDGYYWLHKAAQALQNMRPRADLVVFTDVRYPNEAAFIQENHGFLWRVERPCFVRDGDNHPSETALDAFPYWNETIRNDGTLASLETEVLAAMRGLPLWEGAPND